MSKMNQYFGIYSCDKSEIFCITFYIQKIAVRYNTYILQIGVKKNGRLVVSSGIG